MTIHAPFSPITDFDAHLKFINAKDCAEKFEQRDASGVYSIAVRGLHAALKAAGYEEEPEMPEVWSGEYFHVYVGETYSLKSRTEDHILGLYEGNGFRKSLSIISGRSGASLTQFLMDHAVIGYRYFDFMGDVESYLIKHTACPLNLRGKGASKFACKLRLRRKSYKTF